MLRAAKLHANCTADEYKLEIDNLCNSDTFYVPSIVFERPVGVSHKMGLGSSGPWVPDVDNQCEILQAPADQLAVAGYETGGQQIIK